MSDLADKIRELKATKQFSDVDLHQMAEVMSYAKPEENYQRLKVLLLAGQPLVSREEALGLVAGDAPIVQTGGLRVPSLWRIDRCTKHADYQPECIMCQEEVTTSKTHNAYEAGLRDGLAAAERQMKRGSGG